VDAVVTPRHDDWCRLWVTPFAGWYFTERQPKIAGWPDTVGPGLLSMAKV
jgi:hypothetical protein